MPRDDDDATPADDQLSVDSLEEKGAKRLSPEKEMALQTLDDVLKEAEESMGKLSITVLKFALTFSYAFQYLLSLSPRQTKLPPQN